MKHSDRGRGEATLVLKDRIKRLHQLQNFIQSVPLERPILLHLLYHLKVEQFHPIEETYVVSVLGYRTTTNKKVKGDFQIEIECRIHASKQEYGFCSPYANRSTGGNIFVLIEHVNKWEVLPEWEAPLFLREKSFILGDLPGA